jgi:serine protease
VTQPQPMFNSNDESEADHGTAVLGIVLGRPAGATGVNGIAPKVKFLGVVSRFTSARDPWDVVPAIVHAMTLLKAGDVLLIEVETRDGYPVEADDAMFDGIRLAAARNFIVIEPAGNGTLSEAARNLDSVLSSTPASAVTKNRETGKANRGADRTLNRSTGGAMFHDSGAILVSSCRSSVTRAGAHRRTPSGGYGSRVDCYAWGEDVATCGFGDYAGSAQAENKMYTDTFGGTSSAAAIIAGASILVQQMAVDLRGRPLTPTQMRTLFSGTPGTAVVKGTQTIGVLPDLAAIAARVSSL